jgi:uncharacterized protein YutD
MEIEFQGNKYHLIKEHKDAWNPEVFRERYSDILEKYDYIVGDWGYDQLRLRGFYREDQTKAPKDFKISGLEEYINEYCNFGCAYFVLEKVPIPKGKNGTTKRNEEATSE